LPVGAVDSLGIALVSCSNYPFGFFNAYDAIARDPAIDIVLHTGDYIYEYGGPDGWGRGNRRRHRAST
jgi:alkaline phosphatase D